MRAVLTQAPHPTLYNGSTSEITRQLFARVSQGSVPGPRIAAAIAGMQPGDLRQVHGDYGNGLYSVRRHDKAGGYAIVDWTPRDVWHAPTQQLIRGGRRIRNKIEAYSDVTGETVERAMPAGLARATGTGHWYGLTCHDGDGEHIYLNHYRIHVATWTWQRLPEHIVTNGGSGSMYAWMGNALDGRGALVKYGGNAKRFLMFDPTAWAWVRQVDKLPGGQHALIEYHPAHGRLLMVGGSDTWHTTALVDEFGAVTALPDCPDQVAMTAGCWIVPHPSADCWLVSTRAGRLLALWPDERGWQVIGPSPLPTTQDANAALDAGRGIVLLTGNRGLWAYMPPAL